MSRDDQYIKMRQCYAVCLPRNEYVMSVCDCEEGNRLLKAASRPNSGSVAREAFLEHIKQCPLCNAGGTQDYTDPENSN